MLSNEELLNTLAKLEKDLDSKNSEMCNRIIDILYNSNLGDETLDAVHTLREYLEAKDDLIIKTLKLIIENLK